MENSQKTLTHPRPPLRLFPHYRRHVFTFGKICKLGETGQDFVLKISRKDEKTEFYALQRLRGISRQNSDENTLALPIIT